MRTIHLEPAASIIRLLGGLSAVASAVSTTTATVQRWRRPLSKGGTDGFIPRRWHGKIIEAAQAKGITLHPSAFIDPAALNDTAA